MRRHPRFSLVLSVGYPNSASVFGDWTENVSAGGFFVRTERRFIPGENLRANVSFPGLLPPAPIEGTVAWVRRGTAIVAAGVGVKVNGGEGTRNLEQVTSCAGRGWTGQNGEPFRVLVVDDNSRLIRSYERILESLPTVSAAGVQSMFAANGRVALDMVAQHGADLIITDIYMPEMDGLVMVERLRADAVTSKIPVIVITGGRAGERERASELAVEAFLFKPVLFAPLMQTIATLVDIRRSQAQVVATP